MKTGIDNICTKIEKEIGIKNFSTILENSGDLSNPTNYKLLLKHSLHSAHTLIKTLEEGVIITIDNIDYLIVFNETYILRIYKLDTPEGTIVWECHSKSTVNRNGILVKSFSYLEKFEGWSFEEINKYLSEIFEDCAKQLGYSASNYRLALRTPSELLLINSGFEDLYIYNATGDYLIVKLDSISTIKKENLEYLYDEIKLYLKGFYRCSKCNKLIPRTEKCKQEYAARYCFSCN